MKVGSIVYATEQGLGILAKAYYDHGVVTNVCVVQHGKHTNHPEWYPEAPAYCRSTALELCRECDVMLFFETPFDWTLPAACKRSVLMPMYECFPERMLHQCPFDLYLCPSQLDYNRFKSTGRAVYVPVPVEVPWRQRTTARVFVHNAGHGGLRGRNGTKELVEALRYVRSDAKFVIRTQEPMGFPPYSELLGRVEYREGSVPYSELFAEGDAFVHLDKFSGLSLPLQEATAAGMLVMAVDRFPFNQWVNRAGLVGKEGALRARVGPPYMEVDEAVLSPHHIAHCIDYWYGRDVSDVSLDGRRWAESMSWDTLRPRILRAICESSS